MTGHSGAGRVAVATVDLGLRTRIAVAIAATLALASLIIVLAAPAAEAQPYPGAGAVKAAREAARKQAVTVAELDAAIVNLELALEEAETAVYMAQEAYTEAQWLNMEAQRQLFAANSRADEAEAALEEARDDLAAIAQMSYREGGTFGSFEAIMTSDGFEDVITRTEALDRASREATLAIEQVRAAELVASTMRQYAEDAAEVAAEAELKAREAFAAAVEAERQAKVAYAEAMIAHEEAVARLAELRRVSKDLEAQRQAGLAAARAAQSAAYWQAWVAKSAGTGSGGLVTPTEGTSIGTAAQGEVAVAFALDQVGDAYVYGATGPDSWDCSGLTSVSWATAGVAIPRTSKQQYNYLGKVPYADLRRGDLVFWGYGGDASQVYHASMYIGDNMIVESPRPGYTVKVRDYRQGKVYDLMPYAARP